MNDFEDDISSNSAAEGSIESITKLKNTHSMKDLRAYDKKRMPIKIQNTQTLSKVLRNQKRASRDHLSV